MGFDWSSWDWKQPLAEFDPWRNAPAECAFYPKRAREWCDFFEGHIKLRAETASWDNTSG